MFPLPVEAPEVMAPMHSLLASANLVEFSNAVDDGDEGTDGPSVGNGAEWENGITFTPRGCYILDGTCATCDIDQENAAPQECHAAAVFKPYLLNLGILYRTTERQDIKSLVTGDMEVGTSALLERMIWAGCVGDENPLLSTGDAIAAAAAPKAALGITMAKLIESSTKTGALGTIHMSPRIAVELEDLLLQDNTNGVLRTRSGGHKVIIGDYPTTHIASHVGDIDVYVGDIYVTDAPDEIKRNNTQTFQVQRLAMAAWNTCAAYIQPVTLA